MTAVTTCVKQSLFKHLTYCIGGGRWHQRQQPFF